MIADTGFEVKHSIQIGDREILIAENIDEPDGKHCLKAEYTNNVLIGQAVEADLAPFFEITCGLLRKMLIYTRRQQAYRLSQRKQTDIILYAMGTEKGINYICYGHIEVVMNAVGSYCQIMSKY